MLAATLVRLGSTQRLMTRFADAMRSLHEAAALVQNGDALELAGVQTP